jgi:four helix bundle protein
MKEHLTAFEDLEAWRQARCLTRAVYHLTRRPALERDYALDSQIQRASVSIMSNLAEGFERRHIAEKLQFYNIAKGSAAEVRSLTYVIEDNYPQLESEARQVRAESIHSGKLIAGLIRSTALRRGFSAGLMGIGSLLLLLWVAL